MNVETKNTSIPQRKVAHLLMSLLVILWGLDYIVAKNALSLLEPMQIVCFKYTIGIILFLFMKTIMKVKWKIHLRHIPIFVLCAITGEILYYWCEYEALNYLPVSMITILLTFTPLLSIAVERVLYKRKSNWKINLGIIISILGVGFIIGIDFAKINSETIIGYALCIGAVLAWNVYNFVTSKLRGDYHAVTVGLTQLTCTVIITAPFAYRNLPPIEMFTSDIIWGVIYLGLMSAGLGFFIYIFAIGRLGPTTNAIYSNFLPVSATFFGWIFLGENLGIWQIIGGVITIGAACVVIREKGKLDETRSKLESEL